MAKKSSKAKGISDKDFAKIKKAVIILAFIIGFVIMTLFILYGT
jgi:hypothetical protein